MPIIANTAPYHDDYDEKKHYYRIMFNPGRPVQARELTQMQTMLQKQVERMGDHIFQHGARVFGGNPAYDKCKFIQLSDYENNNSSNPLLDVSELYNSTTLIGAKLVLDDSVETAVDSDGNIITSDGRSPVATILFVTSRNGTTPNTLFVNYETEDEFQAGDTIKSVVDATFTGTFTNAVVTYDTTSSADAATGNAMYVTITDGVYYVKSSSGAHFVHCPQQRIMLSNYSSNGTYSVGLGIEEKFATEIDDNTLYDNAGGTYQPTAAGAHRLQIDLKLRTKPGSDGITVSQEIASDYFELLRIEDGIRVFSAGASASTSRVYSAIGDAMANRTYHAEGNFVVDPFECKVEETNPPSAQLKVTVSPARGKDTALAYVGGREFSLAGSWSKLIDRARGTAILRDRVAPTAIGSYITIRDLKVSNHLGEDVLDAGQLPVWDMHSVNSYNINTSSEQEYNSTRIGSFRLRDLKTSGRFGNTAAANVYTVYIQDYKSSNAITGYFSDVTSDNGKTVKITSTSTLNTSTNAYIGSKLSIVSSVVDGQTDYANQTRIIIASSDTAGTTSLTLDKPFDQPPANTSFPGEGEAFSLVVEPTAALTGNGCIVPSPFKGHAVAITSTNATNFDRVTTANAQFMNAGDNFANTYPIRGGDQASLLFPLDTGGARLANSISESVTGGSLHYIARLSATSTVSGGAVVFNADQFRTGSMGYTTFVEGTQKDNLVVVLEKNAKPIVVGSADLSAYTFTTSSITLESAQLINGDTVRLYAPVLISDVKAKRKSLRQGFNTQGTTYTVVQNRSNGHVIFTTPNKIPGGKDNLGMPDVYKIRAVIDTGAPGTSPTDSMLNNSTYDITNRYTLDNGQREDLYDYASIILKPGAPAPSGQILVVFDHFSHTDDTGAATPEAGFFSVDSYHNQVAIENIPSFVSTTTGVRYNLKDYLDFRPVRATDLTGTTAANTSYYVPIVPTPQTDPTASYAIGQVDAAGAFFYWMQYFAARFDKIILGDRETASGGNTGMLQIVSGSTNRSPATMPKVSKVNDLSLFTLAIPSYTKQASDVVITKDSVRRYTMTDIDKLEKRIERLERISTLNQIEQMSSSLKLVDDQGIEYFKNGILVDTFEGLSSSDVGVPGSPNPQFNASIGSGRLRPAVEQDNLDLIIDPTSSSNYFAKNNILMLLFTTSKNVRGLVQAAATVGGAENINPFQIQPFYGTMSLTPSSDNWHSTRDLPLSVSDRTSARLAAENMVQNRLDRGEGNPVWGSWETEWFGAVETESTYFRDPDAAYQYVVDNPPFPGGGKGMSHVIFTDSSGNAIWNPVDGYSYASNDETGAYPGVKNLRSVNSVNAPQDNSGYVGGIIDYVAYNIRKPHNDVKNATTAGQVRVQDELLQEVIVTEQGTRTRSGVQTEFSIKETTNLVDEVALSDIVYPYMRPVMITFRGRGMKPKTTVYPIFDNVNVENYTERANELILKMNPVSLEWTNPFGNLTEEEMLSDATTGAYGTAVAVFANTVYLTSANGTFVLDNAINRSRTASTPAVIVEKYKQYSGRFLATPSTTTFQLFDTRIFGQTHWRTTAITARAASLDTDLYGRKLHVVYGRGYGESRTITAFDETTGVVTVDSAFSLQPNTSSRYSIGEHYTNLAGEAFGIFYVPNYSYANRTAQEYVESLSTSDIYWKIAELSDQRTTDTLRFTSGNKTFSLRSSPSPFESDLTTHVEATFSSSGTINTRKYRSVFDIETRIVNVTEAETLEPRTSTTVTSLGQQLTGDVVKYFDPVAQTFVVDPNLYPGGIFINGVDIWFETKHRSDAGTVLPVILEIRPTIAGVPSGSQVIASTSLLPSDVKTTTNPALFNNTSTSFIFDRPIMLESGKEYAIVLRSDSLDYSVWTAKLGDALVGTGGNTGIPEKVVDKQPHYGSFFKSQNGVTWEPEQLQDLMFAVHKCIFTPNQTTTVIWKNANTHSDTTADSSVSLNSPLDHINLSSVTGVPASTPYFNSTEFKQWQSDFSFDEFRVDTTSLEFPSSSVEWEYDCVKEGETQVPNPFVLEFTETDGYNSMLLGTNTKHPTSRLKILKNQTGSFLLKGKLSTTSVHLSPIINLERIGVTLFKNVIDNGGLHANTWPYSQVYTADGTIIGGGFTIKNSGTGYADTDTITVTPSSGSIGGGATGTVITDGSGSIIGVNLTNKGQSYVTSPVITVSGGNGDAEIEYVGEDNGVHPGNYQARYVSKRVRLQQGVESRDIRVIVTAAIPPEADIHVFAKVRSSSDNQPFKEKKWQLLRRPKLDAIQTAGESADSIELVFRGTGNDDTYPFAYTSSPDGVNAAAGEGDRYTTFNEFAIKIVMQTSDSRFVPVIHDMRAIAVE